MNGTEAIRYLMDKTKDWPEMIIFVNWGVEVGTGKTTLVAAYSAEITEKASFDGVPAEQGIPGSFFALTEKIFTKKGLNRWLEQIK